MKKPTIGSRYDAVVVGARCAGAATAMLLARRGLRVLAVERSRYGSDTLSTHALMRVAVLQLSRWEVLPKVVAAGTPAIRETSFHYEDEAVTVPIKPRDGVDALYAPRRSVLDAALVDAAVAAGVTVLHETRVVDLVRDDGGRVRGVVVQSGRDEPRTVEAGIVVGADGRGSTVAARTGAETYHRGRHTSAVIYAYFEGLERSGYHFLYGPATSSGVIETTPGEEGEGQCCVFAAMPDHRFLTQARYDLEGGFSQVLAESSPKLAAEVSRARRVTPLRGFAGEIGFFRQSWGPGWALVGDAGYFKDPITAHGITDALRDAELLARAIADGSRSALAGYQEERDAISRELFDATDEIASYDWTMEEVQSLHLQMSKSMGPELEVVKGWDELALSA